MENKPVRGFLFACTNKSEEECLSGNLFATEKSYGPVVIRIRKGDLLFLNNIDTDTLFGVFRAVSDGGFNPKSKAFGGKYPYQVKVKPLGESIAITKAKRLLNRFGVKRNTPLFSKRLVDFLEALLLTTPRELGLQDDDMIWGAVREQIQVINRAKGNIDIEDEIPLVEATNFWDFKKQSYGLAPKGDNKYAAVTPALVIFNMVWRYTDPGDLVVDPMCGSGTTIDVCREEQRRVIGYDIHSTRPDVIKNDARHIPLDDNTVDMVFIDSPYGDNIKYDSEPLNIGNISSESERFYHELETVMIECKRILKENKVLGWLIGDQWVRGLFTPVGLRVYERLCKHFEPVDIVCVSRKGQHSHTGMWYNRARRFNFYLRGFKYLIIVRKTSEKPTRKVKWAYYQRGKNNEA